MPEPHLLIVAVDGLRASALGAYGNTSFATPAIDRLAAESFLLDSCFGVSPELAAVYRSLWQSRHVLRPAASAASEISLPRWLSERGYATTLITDEPRLVSFAGADEFDECIEIPLWPVSRPCHEPDRKLPDSLCGVGRSTHNKARGCADDVADTSLARLFAAACECFESDRPQLLWVHVRGMYGPWDAPLELQEPLLADDDFEPCDVIEPPELATDDDPDAAFLYGCAYAAQIMVLDTCVGGLMEAAHAAWPGESWLLVLLGARGYPLGEHGRIGGEGESLYAEQLHVPWLVRFPDGSGRLARSGDLTSHLDLLPTLVEWITGAAPPADRVDGRSILPLVHHPRPAWREALISCCPAGDRAIRTPGWCLQRMSDPDAAMLPHQETPNAALYVRPDDRREVNDVAKLCPDVVAGLTEIMTRISQEIITGRPMPAKELPNQLHTSAS